MVSSALLFQASSPSLFSMQFIFSGALQWPTSHHTPCYSNIFLFHLNIKAPKPTTNLLRAWAPMEVSRGLSGTQGEREAGSAQACSIRLLPGYFGNHFQVTLEQPGSDWEMCLFGLVVDGYMESYEKPSWCGNLGHMRRLPRGGGSMYQVGWSLTTCARVKHQHLCLLWPEKRPFGLVVDGYMESYEKPSWYGNLGHMRRLPRGGGSIYQVGWSLTTCARVKHQHLPFASFAQAFPSILGRNVNFRDAIQGQCEYWSKDQGQKPYFKVTSRILWKSLPGYFKVTRK